MTRLEDIPAETIRVYVYDDVGIYQDAYDLLRYRYIEDSGYTTVKPPTLNQNEVAVFNTETKQWGVVKDYRATPVFNTITGSYGFVDYLGELQPPHTNDNPTSIDMSKQSIY